MTSPERVPGVEAEPRTLMEIERQPVIAATGAVPDQARESLVGLSLPVRQIEAFENKPTWAVVSPRDIAQALSLRSDTQSLLYSFWWEGHSCAFRAQEDYETDAERRGWVRVEIAAGTLIQSEVTQE